MDTILGVNCKYDLNPIITARWPKDQDTFENYFSSDHRLFWIPKFDFSQCSSEYNLIELCDKINDLRKEYGDDGIFAAGWVNYDLSNLVKLNVWTYQLRNQGNIKPWLVIDEGNDCLVAATGDSRLKCLERLPHIAHVEAFVTTHVEHSDRYSHALPVQTFDQFAQLCQAEHNQTFLFKFTNDPDNYGLRWYEFDTRRTAVFTPGDDYTLPRLRRYLQQHPEVTFTPEWFDILIDWDSYS
jgi:hypothetical protein